MSERRVRVRRAATLCVLLALGACAGAPDASSKPKRFTVAGVTTVENPPRASAPAVFHLSDSIVRDIGGLKEKTEDEFNHRNGFINGVVLSDGGFAVMDWTKVRVFDKNGTQMAVIGRQGSGPGEFQGLGRLCATRGDTLLAFDVNQMRMNVVAAATVVRQFQMDVRALPAQGCLSDGSFLAQGMQKPTGGDVPSAPVVRVTLDGVTTDTLGKFPSQWFEGIAQYMGVTAHGAWMYVSDPHKSEVRRYDVHGKLNLVVKMADAARPIDTDNAARWLGGAVAARGSGVKAGGNQRVEGNTWPFYRSILVDQDGRLWIRDFPPNDAAPDRWTAYDSTGAVIGALNIPRPARRPVPGAPPGDTATMPGYPREFVDAFGDFIIVLEYDDDGAVHFRTRKIR